MLYDPAVRYVVAGRVVAVEGLPETLLDADHEFEVKLRELDQRGAVSVLIEGRPAATIDATDVQVDARLSVRNVLKPSPRCPHPPRVADAARCERADSPPAELTFASPATGSSGRPPARRGAWRAGPASTSRRCGNSMAGVTPGRSANANTPKERKCWRRGSNAG